MSEREPTEEDTDWMCDGKNIKQMCEEDIDSFFTRMEPREALRRATFYRVHGSMLKHSQEREMIELEWKRRVGTTFPGWKESDLYSVAGWADILGGEVAGLSPGELYHRAMDALVGPERLANNGLHQYGDGAFFEYQSGRQLAEQRQTLTGDNFGDSRLAAPPGDEQAAKGKAANILEALLDDEDYEILKIAQSQDSADSRMRAICHIDRRGLSWQSLRWAKLLDVTDAAVRKTKFWKRDRGAAIEADRAIEADLAIEADRDSVTNK